MSILKIIQLQSVQRKGRNTKAYKMYQLRWELYSKKLGECFTEYEDCRAPILRIFSALAHDTNTTIRLNSRLWNSSFTKYILVPKKSIHILREDFYVLLFEVELNYGSNVNRTLNCQYQHMHNFKVID